LTVKIELNIYESLDKANPSCLLIFDSMAEKRNSEVRRRLIFGPEIKQGNRMLEIKQYF
jgi:hypothetical protein